VRVVALLKNTSDPGFGLGNANIHAAVTGAVADNTAAAAVAVVVVYASSMVGE
jgi:hypothetical protein